MGCGDSKDDDRDNSDDERDDGKNKKGGDGGLVVNKKKPTRSDSDSDSGSENERRKVHIGEGSSESLKTFSASQFEKTSEYDYLFKILLLGSQGVGKSSLLARFADNEFLDTYRTTVGVDFKIRTVEIDDKTIKLQLWDTAGQERFKTVTNTYFRGAHGVILVYDVTDNKSFSQIDAYWLNEVKNNAPANAVLMIVGNKIDLENRAVSSKTGKEYAQDRDALFLETSAKDDKYVSKAFLALAEAIKSRIR